MTQRKGWVRVATLVLVAGIAGIAAGALAVYLRVGGDGNALACAASSEKARNLVRFAHGAVAAFTPADPARLAPALQFRDAEGHETSLSARLQAAPDRLVLVNLWAIWCVPCREEMPALDRLQASQGGEGFEVVAINIDTNDDGRPNAFLEEIGVTHLARYSDPTTGVFNAMRGEGYAIGLPSTLLVDGRGCVLGHMAGPAVWDSADAVALIDAARRAE